MRINWLFPAVLAQHTSQQTGMLCWASVCSKPDGQQQQTNCSLNSFRYAVAGCAAMHRICIEGMRHPFVFLLMPPKTALDALVARCKCMNCCPLQHANVELIAVFFAPQTHATAILWMLIYVSNAAVHVWHAVSKQCYDCCTAWAWFLVLSYTDRLRGNDAKIVSATPKH